MREQWRKFLDENAHCWTYNIVPELVEQLAEALEAGDGGLVMETLDALSAEGIVIDHNGNLCFSCAFILV